jgi:hypothetical protein
VLSKDSASPSSRASLAPAPAVALALAPAKECIAYAGGFTGGASSLLRMVVLGALVDATLAGWIGLTSVMGGAAEMSSLGFMVMVGCRVCLSRLGEKAGRADR